MKTGGRVQRRWWDVEPRRRVSKQHSRFEEQKWRRKPSLHRAYKHFSLSHTHTHTHTRTRTHTQSWSRYDRRHVLLMLMKTESIDVSLLFLLRQEINHRWLNTYSMLWEGACAQRSHIVPGPITTSAAGYENIKHRNEISLERIVPQGWSSGLCVSVFFFSKWIFWWMTFYEQGDKL